jgi:phage terminase large subunit
METIRLPIKITRIYDENYNIEPDIDLIINRGGAGSSKSHSIIQVLLQKGLEHNGIKILILRKVRASLGKSVYNQFITYIKEIGIYDETKEHKSDYYYELPNGTQIHFAGLDDRQKLKSSEWNIIWLEEANEFSRDDYNFIKTRKYRGDKFPNLKPVIYMSFNPEQCWIEKIENADNVKLIHSTYKDNPFCNEEYKKTLEGLREEDVAIYNIYALGLYARPEHTIYKPLIYLKEYPKEFNETIYGLDFGYNNPSALCKIGIKDIEFYLDEQIYQTKLTNADLIELLKGLSIGYDPIYCDSAEPNRIEELRRAGFNALPADKVVKDGIDFCKRKKFYTTERNVNVNKEWSGYSYKKDKQGNVTDEPVKFLDHFPDCIRYAVFTHFSKGEVKATFL